MERLAKLLLAAWMVAATAGGISIGSRLEQSDYEAKKAEAAKNVSHSSFEINAGPVEIRLDNHQKMKQEAMERFEQEYQKEKFREDILYKGGGGLAGFLTGLSTGIYFLSRKSTKRHSKYSKV